MGKINGKNNKKIKTNKIENLTKIYYESYKFTIGAT